MILELNKEIREFCKGLIQNFDAYCNITQDGRSRRSYIVNGVLIENDIVSNTATIYIKDEEPIYWDYYDTDLDQWYLPKKEFVEIFCKFAKDVEDFQNIQEFQELDQLKKILRESDFRC